MSNTERPSGNFIPLTMGTTTEIGAQARAISKKRRGKYVTVVNCFGPYAVVSDRLSVDAPSETCLGHYWLNGKAHRYTDAQVLADSARTMKLSGAQ